MAGSGDDSHVVSTADVRALVSTDMTDLELQDVIARESAWLARRVGYLTGSRTVRIYISDADLDNPIILQRPTDAVDVLDYGVLVDDADLRLLGDGTKVELATGAWTGPYVEITYTPNDLSEVQRVMIELVRLTAIETGYAGERIGEYSYTRFSGVNPTQGTAASRIALARELLSLPRYGSVRLRSSEARERIGAVIP